MAPGRGELVSELRDLIARAGVVPAEVARLTGISEATLSRYLNAKVVPGPGAVRKIVTALGTAGTDRAERAVALAEDLRAGTASRVVVLRSGTATRQRRYAEIESGSEHITSFTPLLVPGLLQIEPYARAVFSSAGQAGETLERNLRDRISGRQALLASPGHRFTQVMTEGALRWQVRSAALMSEQVRHIARMAERDTGGRVRIGIIPWTATVDVFPLTNFDLYDDQRAVIVGTDFGTSFLDRPRDVAVYVEQFGRLARSAAFDGDAVPELERIAADYDARG